jgi:hypothetical protein
VCVGGGGGLGSVEYKRPLWWTVWHYPPPTHTHTSPPDSTLSFPVIARGHQTELSEPPIAVL